MERRDCNSFPIWIRKRSTGAQFHSFVSEYGFFRNILSRLEALPTSSLRTTPVDASIPFSSPSSVVRGISSIEFDSQGVLLVSGCSDGWIHIHDFDSWILSGVSSSSSDSGRNPLESIHCPDSIQSVRWNPSNEDEILVGRNGSQSLAIYDLGNGGGNGVPMSECAGNPRGRKGLVDFAPLSSPSTFVLASGDGFLAGVDRRSSSSTFSLSSPSSSLSTVLSAPSIDPSLVIDFGSSGISIWDIRSSRSVLSSFNLSSIYYPSPIYGNESLIEGGGGGGNSMSDAESTFVSCARRSCVFGNYPSSLLCSPIEASVWNDRSSKSVSVRLRSGIVASVNLVSKTATGVTRIPGFASGVGQPRQKMASFPNPMGFGIVAVPSLYGVYLYSPRSVSSMVEGISSLWSKHPSVTNPSFFRQFAGRSDALQTDPVVFGGREFQPLLVTSCGAREPLSVFVPLGNRCSTEELEAVGMKIEWKTKLARTHSTTGCCSAAHCFGFVEEPCLPLLPTVIAIRPPSGHYMVVGDANNSLNVLTVSKGDP